MIEYSREYYEKSRYVLEMALHTVPAYEEWQKYDPGPDKPLDERYAAMPFLHKSMIRQYFPDGLVPEGKDVRTALDRGEIGTASTSGSSDISAVNIWNQQWWDASERASWKLNAHTARVLTGDQPEAILANPLNVGIPSDNSELSMQDRKLDRFLYLNEMTDPSKWPDSHMDRMLEELAVFQPVSLEANPSFLARLSRYIAEKGKTVYQPKLIVFTYEYPTVLHLRQIQQVFTSPLISSYGSTETGYVFMQCEEGKYHQNTDFCRVDFQPFKPEFGGPSLGRILVTTFNNPWYYMVRFDIRDLVRIDSEGSCACGRNNGLILSAIEGRMMSMTLTCDGKPVSLRTLDTVMGTIKGIIEYKLEQHTETGYALCLVSERNDKNQLIGEVVAALQNLYGEKAEVTVAFSDALSPEDSGKYNLAKTLFPVDIERFIA